MVQQRCRRQLMWKLPMETRNAVEPSSVGRSCHACQSMSMMQCCKELNVTKDAVAQANVTFLSC